MENLISKYKNLINLISLKTLQRKYINIKKLITFNKKVFDLIEDITSKVLFLYLFLSIKGVINFFVPNDLKILKKEIGKLFKNKTIFLYTEFGLG